MTLNQFVELLQRIENDEQPNINFAIHPGIHEIIGTFGSASDAAIFFSKVLDSDYDKPEGTD